jgi:hypothetical protein
MAILEIDHLVRSTGVSIIVLFLHAYLMAEKGTEHMVQNDEDEIDKLNNNPNPNDEETGLT